MARQLLARADRQEVVPLPCPPHQLKPPTDLRGTVLCASQQLAREAGRVDAYFAALPEEYHDSLRFVVPLTWVPLEIARAHYRAMEVAFPNPLQQVQNGRLASERTQKAYLQTIIRALHGTGQLSTLDVIKRAPSAVERMVRNGGAVRVFSLGPKDARVEMHAHPLAETAYIRNSWQGMFEAGIGMAARRIFVRQDEPYTRDDRVAFDISWV